MVDAYVLRSMHRRCNYDYGMVSTAFDALAAELELRYQGFTSQLELGNDGSKLAYYITQYVRSGLADVVILPYIKDAHDTQYLSTEHMEKLMKIIGGMLQHPSFELVTIHDAFKAHANNCNQVRFQYKEILAEIAESNLLADLLSQIHGKPGTYPKLSNNLGALIRGSNYALS